MRRITSLRVYTYEIYVYGPKRQPGWDVKTLSIFAQSISEAAAIRRDIDCISDVITYASEAESFRLDERPEYVDIWSKGSDYCID